MTTSRIDSIYGIGADVFAICKSHEPLDLSEVCGQCGETAEDFHSVIGSDGGWVTVCDLCWTRFVVAEVKP